MSVVLKFPLSPVDEQYLMMPEPADLLHVGEQDGVLTLWARVPEMGPYTMRTILVRGTGHHAGDEPHIGTAICDNGFVWHVFDGGVFQPQSSVA